MKDFSLEFQSIETILTAFLNDYCKAWRAGVWSHESHYCSACIARVPIDWLFIEKYIVTPNARYQARPSHYGGFESNAEELWP